MSKHNERFVIWAQKHGNTPEEQIKQDRASYPGGAMRGYMLWIHRNMLEYPGYDWDQNGFTQYLRDSAALTAIAKALGDPA